MKFCPIKFRKLKHVVLYMAATVLEKPLGCWQNQEVKDKYLARNVDSNMHIHLRVPTIKWEAFD